MSIVHPTAVVASKAEIAEDVEIGPYALVQEGASIGEGTVISSHAVLKPLVSIGRNCIIGEHAVLGGLPQDSGFKGEESYLKIGDETRIGEFATLHRATGRHEVTSVGRGCLIMAYCHVSHNCLLDDGVTLANGVQLAGYARIGDGAFLGGLAGIHQFVRVGRLGMVGAHSYLTQDLPPFLLGSGNPFRVAGLNRVGLKRAGLTEPARNAISRLYKLIYIKHIPPGRALSCLPQSEQIIPEIAEFCKFLKTSRRGIRLKSGICDEID